MYGVFSFMLYVEKRDACEVSSLKQLVLDASFLAEEDANSLRAKLCKPKEQ
jgi:hypothetical protein